MSKYLIIKAKNGKQFVRRVGINKTAFEIILKDIKEEI